MRYPVLTIRRADLVSAKACAQWLMWFDDVCRLRGDDRAPLVRRGGVTRRDPTRLRIVLTPLAQVWLSLPLSPSSGTAWAWLRDHRVVGTQNLGGTILTGADLRGAVLRGADLRGTILTGADLRGTILTGADLRGTILDGVDLRGTILDGVDLDGAVLTGAFLDDAVLTGVVLTGAFLDDAVLTGTVLRGADLRGAVLTGADLRGTILDGVDLDGADLSGARRWADDAPILGWVVRDGVLVRGGAQ